MDLEQYFNKKIELEIKQDHRSIKYSGILTNLTKKQGIRTYYFLKLNSGYNIGIDSHTIKSVKLLKAEKESIIHKKVQEIEKDDSKPIISLLHFGGTIASKVDYKTGAVIAEFSPEDLISMFPELKDIANIESEFIGNLWSQDLRFEHYNILAKQIEKEIKKGVKGIIVAQGTDTLHYTSAALSFMLKNCPVPVILVGSQRSSDRGSTDAALNLIDATYFIANSDFAGVAVCMHNSSSDDYCAIIPGTRARKMHSTRRDSFKTINANPYALVDFNNAFDKIVYVNKDYPKYNENAKFIVKYFDPKLKIAVIKQHTHMFAEEFLLYKDYDAIVIESTGLGNLPISEMDDATKEHSKIFNVLSEIIKRGTIIVLSPQTIFGRLNLNVYENARRQQEIGILGDNNDMTTETTFIKLAWLLSNYDNETTKELIMKNLRGELSDHIGYKKDFV